MKLSKQQIQQLLVKPRDFRLIQNIIYFFNESHIRNHIFDHFLKHLYPDAPFHYIGTFYLKQGQNTDINDLYDSDSGQSFKSLLKQSLESVYGGNKKQVLSNKTPNILFTVCLNYEESKVHFVSFIYEPLNRRLVSFDSGSNLYLVGERVIIPTVQHIFDDFGFLQDVKKSKHHIGVCPGKHFSKKFGIQFSGENPLYTKLPADAFCQSWSVFFLTQWIRTHRTDRVQHGSFVRKWCEIPPVDREWYIICHFFLPLLTFDPFLKKEFDNFYPGGNIDELHDRVLSDRWAMLPKNRQSSVKPL